MKELLKFKSFADMLEKLPDDNSCREYLELMRWDNTPACPHCACVEPYKLKTNGEFKGLYKCSGCKERFTVAIGTMFEGSKVGFRKWLIAIYIFQSHKKGISSYQLSKDLGITQKSAWFMLHRIRNAMKDRDKKLMTGIIQIDESYVGGRNKNRHRDKKIKGSQGRNFKDKTPIIGFMGNGKVRCVVANDTKNSSIHPAVLHNVEVFSTIVTDEYSSYTEIGKYYSHEVVHHEMGLYVNDSGFTTNALEGFWKWIKAGFIAIYHHFSRKHMQAYADEYSFRYNYHKEKENERFNILLGNLNDSRIMYKDLIKRRA